jgi:hypothetical protein
VTFEVKHGGQNAVFAVTVGLYPDDRPGEVFIDGAKSGSDMASTTHDGAILLSLALQHGVPLETIKGAVSRNLDGKATSIIGVVVDKLTEQI